MIEFSLLKERQTEFIIKGFDSATQVLTGLIKFCERLETAEELFQTQGEVNHQNKNSSSPANATNLAQRKGSYEAANPSDEDANKNKNQKKKITCVPPAWSWSRYELVQGHVGTSKSHEVDLVDCSPRRRRPRKVPGR